MQCFCVELFFIRGPRLPENLHKRANTLYVNLQPSSCFIQRAWHQYLLINHICLLLVFLPTKL